MTFANTLKWTVPIVLLAFAGVSTHAADKEDSKKDAKERAKKDEKVKSAPKDGADLFKPTSAYEAKEKAARNIADEIENEVAARAVPIPAEMGLELDWYSPHFDANKVGKITKGWVIDELVLLETDKHNLIAVRREDGVERWRCELTDTIRYSPSVSRNNVIVNVNNYLVGIEKNAGYVRWKLLPTFVMSNSPLIIDPAAYPKEYTKSWKPLETIFVGGWDGRFYDLNVRGRIGYFLKQVSNSDNFNAPEFDLYYPWHKTHKDRGIISSNIVLKDNILYYVADDHNVYAVTREGGEREPYYLLGVPTTGLTVTAPAVANVTNSVLNSIYVGARDNYVYCLDRLTLKKKWAFPAGYPALGNILADEAQTPMVYVATTNGMVNGLKVTPSMAQKGQPEIPESFEKAWEVPAAGAITVSPDVVYLGTGRTGDSYKGIVAVAKDSGKVLWKSETGFFTQYLEFFNSWSKPDSEARVFAISADNRLISLKEKVRATGIRVIKEPTPEVEQPKFTKVPKKEGADAAAPAPEKKDEKKEEAPKKEEAAPKKEDEKK